MKCPTCGRDNDDASTFCGGCGASLQAAKPPASDKRLVAGLCAIFAGCFGVHKFILGYNREGLILLAVTLVSFFLLSPFTAIVAIIEGVIYITKSDEEFVRTYITNKRPWF